MADVMQPLGYYRFLAGDLMSPIGLAAVPGGIPVAANAVMLTVDGSAVRFRDDGVPPDGGTGMAIQPTLNPFCTPAICAPFCLLRQAVLYCTFRFIRCCDAGGCVACP